MVSVNNYNSSEVQHSEEGKKLANVTQIALVLCEAYKVGCCAKPTK